MGKTYPEKVRKEERAEARKRRRRRYRNAPPALVTLRMAELFKVWEDRYGGAPLPHDDSGLDDIRLAFQTLSECEGAAYRMVSVARIWAPWLTGNDLDSLVDDVTAHPRRFRADTVAERLGITDANRTRLQLRTIGAIDKSAKQREDERAEKKRLAKQMKRRAAGVPTIAESRAARASKKPWVAAGLSRSTWYRHRSVAAEAAE